MKSLRKKIVIVTMITVMTLMSIITVNAAQARGKYTGSKTLKYNNSIVETKYSAYLYWPNALNKCQWSGTSSTMWHGKSPYNADSIRHTNSIYVGGIGSLSFGNDAVGLEVSGSTIEDVMEVTNKWYIKSNYTYDIKRSIFITSTDFSVSGRIQFGSNFYSLSCGT